MYIGEINTTLVHVCAKDRYHYMPIMPPPPPPPPPEGQEGENPSEKPSLGSRWWDLNLWPLTPQSSALTTRPPSTSRNIIKC